MLPSPQRGEGSKAASPFRFPTVNKGPLIRVNAMIRCLWLIGLLALVGCGGGPGPQSPEEIAAAQSAVTGPLDAWKAGEPASKWNKDTGTVKFVDEEWKLGSVLLDYKMGKAEGLKGENTRCSATLTLRDRKGKKSDREVVYSVKPGTPTLVSRDPFY
jgi:hypothetical protein